MNPCIIIATHGNSEWQTLAEERAFPSAAHQAPTYIWHDTDGSIASVRNMGVELAPPEFDWLCFLDADDELAEGYIAAMKEAEDGDDALLTPRVAQVHGRKSGQPFFFPEVDLRDGNWLVIGTMISRKLFAQVGGFWEEPIYEDWSLFARCVKEGARIIRVPDAIYRAYPTRSGRNHALDRRGKLEAHYAIGKSIWPEHYGESWRRQHIRSKT
jgi:glycosyltransferase involved in cell wall biosynthesis